MKQLKLGLVLFAFLMGCSWLRAEEKSYPPNQYVELVGTVKEGLGYDANKKREPYYFLRLDKPIAVAADQYSEERKGIRDLQLVLLHGAKIGHLVGKHIAVKGKLSHAFSAHHHTKVLLELDKSTDARLTPDR